MLLGHSQHSKHSKKKKVGQNPTFLSTKAPYSRRISHNPFSRHGTVKHPFFFWHYGCDAVRYCTALSWLSRPIRRLPHGPDDRPHLRLPDMGADAAPCGRQRGASRRLQAARRPPAPHPPTSLRTVSLGRSPTHFLPLHVARAPTAALVAATACRQWRRPPCHRRAPVDAAGGRHGAVARRGGAAVVAATGGLGGVAETARQGSGVRPSRRARRRNAATQRGGTTRARPGHSKTPLHVGGLAGRRRHGTDDGGHHPAICVPPWRTRARRPTVSTQREADRGDAPGRYRRRPTDAPTDVRRGCGFHLLPWPQAQARHTPGTLAGRSVPRG